MPPWAIPRPSRCACQRFEFGTVCAREPDMIETETMLVEVTPGISVGELVQSDECATDEPHDVTERSGVLVDHRIASEEPSIPRHTPIEVADRERHVVNRREIGHVILPFRSRCVLHPTVRPLSTGGSVMVFDDVAPRTNLLRRHLSG